MNKIPAKVSETEIIMPPGVVSYYGVKFFEDLRAQAKQDFARMEAEGRVGGEPVDTNGMPMEQDEELTPEEMQMLAEALGQAPAASVGMNEGGSPRRLSDKKDIAEFRDENKGFRDTSDQILRLLNPFYDTEGANGWIRKKYPFLTGPAADAFFENSPVYKSYDDGLIVKNSSGNTVVTDLGAKSSLNEKTFLKNFVAEMMELSDRDMEGTITPEEKVLLDAYQEFATRRTGMAMGGMVPQQQPMYDPYEQQQTQYTPPAPVFQSTRTGMQEGGLAEEAAKSYTGPTFNPSQYSYGGGFSSPFGKKASTSSGGMEIKEYVNPDTGQTRMITVLNGEPIGLVPEGFIPASQEAKQQAQETKQEVETKTEGARVGMGGKDSADVGPEAPEAPDFGEMSDEQLGQAHSSITGPNKTLANLVGIANPIAGFLSKQANKKMKKDVEEEMVKRNIDIPDEEEVSLMDIAKDMFGISEEDVEGSMGTTDPMGDVGFTGDTRGTTGEALGRAGEAPGPGPSRGRSGEALGRADEAPGPGPSRGRSGEALGRADEAPGPGPSRGRSGEALGRADEAPGPGPSRGRSSEAPGRADEAPGPGPSRGRSSGPSGPAGASGTAGVGGPSGDSDAGTPRFEGGLMGKPEGSQNKKRKPNQRKKPIKNRKGLASK